MIDVERLRHDLDYWDERDPTGGEATHYREDATYVVWYRIRGGNREYLSACTGCTWVETESSGGKFIPRPTRKQWSGPEDGLPPIGSECTIEDNGRLQYGADHAGRPMEVVAHVEYCAVLRLDWGLGCFDLTALRPLKSEKERVVDAVIRKMGWTNSVASVLEGLYDLGALKMPEEDQ